MLRPAVLILMVIGLLAGCQSSEPTPASTDPDALLAQVVDNLQSIETFRVLMEQHGADYPFLITLDMGQSAVEAVMQRAEGQYEAPDVLFANIKLRVTMGEMGVTITADVFSRGTDQWVRLPGGPGWQNFPFADGFDPGELLSEDEGFEAALEAMQELEYIALTTLDDGTRAHHVRGTASGSVVSALLFDLLEITSDVIIDAYISSDDLRPARLVVTLPGTETEAEPEPTRWVLEVYEINAATEIDYPDAVTDEQ